MLIMSIETPKLNDPGFNTIMQSAITESPCLIPFLSTRALALLLIFSSVGLGFGLIL